MKHCLGLFLLVCCGMFHLASGLSCFTCNNVKDCQTIKTCTSEDVCLSLKYSDGMTIKQCYELSECSNAKLSIKFPSIKQFTYRCCSGNLCNAGNTVTTATPVLALGALLSIWWCWI